MVSDGGPSVSDANMRAGLSCNLCVDDGMGLSPVVDERDKNSSVRDVLAIISV